MQWPRLLAYIRGRVDKELLVRNEYLGLRIGFCVAKIKGRLQLSDGEKRSLAEIAHVAEVYHFGDHAPFIPGSFYRDPFSDMIPRERIYEIWSQEPLVKLGNTDRTRSQCITDYSNAVKNQVAALRSVIWKFGADMAGRLNFGARPLNIHVPFNFQNMSEDGRLWYAWALLEEAYKTVDLR